MLNPDSEVGEDNSSQVMIVALTAYTTELFAKKCFEAGMNDFITKPLNCD